MLLISAPCEAAGVEDWRSYVVEASSRFGVPPSWIEHVMRAESNGRTVLNGQPIRSRVGAIGLMQLMPMTWRAMQQALGLGLNPDDPHDNILAGTFYLRLMYDRFGYPGMFAAYNAGPGRYAMHIATGRALPGETIAYVRNVAGASASWSPAPPETHHEAPRDTLFFVQRQAADPVREMANASLFVVRNVGP